MKVRMNRLVLSLCLSGLVSMPAFAVVTASNSATNAQIAQINAQTKMLESELASLKQQVRSLKGQVSSNGHVHNSMQRYQSYNSNNVSSNTPTTTHTQAQANQVQAETDGPLTGGAVLKAIAEDKDYLPFDLDVPGQAFVSTGPYVGVPIQFAGSNLVVNSPSVNTDVQLLNIRKGIIDQLTALGADMTNKPFHSHLLFSGVVEGQANYTDVGGAPSTSYLDMSNIALDAFFIGPSDWTLGFIEFEYDNLTPKQSAYGSAYNSSYTDYNSRVLINKAFITVGDFDKSPFYGTFGQYYVPFGAYPSIMVTSVLTQDLMRTKARAIELGMQQQSPDAFYGSIYAFKGDSYPASVDKINNGGINVGYKVAVEGLNVDIGGGVIGNIADSAGMQIGTNFQASEQIKHRVPGYDLRGNFQFGPKIDLIAEFMSATTQFNPNDMSYNNHGAQPSALDTELSYSFTAFTHPSAIGIGYAKSNQALAMGLPLARYSLVMNTSIWRNTLESLEFRHDRSYAASDTANGPVGASSVPGTCTASMGGVGTCTSNGKADNAVTAQFDYYF